MFALCDGKKMNKVEKLIFKVAASQSGFRDKAIKSFSHPQACPAGAISPYPINV